MAVVANQSLSIISTDANNNTAVVEYNVTAKTSGESWQGYTQEGTFYIDGVKYTNKYTLPENTTTTVFSKRVTINNASGRQISASYSFYTTPSYGTLTGSTSVDIPVLVQAPSITSLSLKSKTLSSLTFKYNLSSKADKIYYKLSTQNSYTEINSNSSSGEFTVNNLSPNISYTINFKARNTSGSINKDADLNISGTTYQIAKISILNDFIHGDNINMSITNPSGSPVILKVLIDSMEILNKSVNSGNNTIQLNDEQLDKIYKKYGSNNTVTAVFNVVTNNNSNYIDSKEVTCTIKGNQKIAYTKNSGVIKRCKCFIKQDGKIKKAVIWVGNNGRKRCI